MSDIDSSIPSWMDDDIPSWMDVDEEPADALPDTNDNSSVPSWMDVENHLLPVDATHIEIPESVIAIHGNGDDSDSDSDDSSVEHGEEMNKHSIAPNDMLMKGLEVVRYDEKMLKRCQEKTNIKRFKSSYGVSHNTMCIIYEDIQSQDLIDESTNPPTPMFLKGKEINLRWFLRTVYFMRKYPTGDNLERQLTRNESWSRKKIWSVMKKIQFLKHKKITWEDGLGGDDIWVLTVDGTHVWIYEPGHPLFSQDSDYYSHKFNKAGINYELGIALASQHLIWLTGHFQPEEMIFKTLTRRGYVID